MANDLPRRIKMELAGRVARLTANGRTPGLGTLLVGENPSSARYVEMKIEECKEIGVRSFDVHLASRRDPGRDRSGCR